MLFAGIARACCALALLCAVAAAHAHPSPTSLVLLDVKADRIEAELTMPLDELQLVFDHPLVRWSDRKPLVADAEMAAYLAAHIRPTAPDGRAWLVKVEKVGWLLGRQPADVVATVTLRPPPGAPVGTLALTFDVIAHHVMSHITLVALREPGAGTPRMLATLRFGQHVVAITDADAHWWSSSADLYKLGMRHIAEGSDHLLFLLTLLLPAALLIQGGRWGAFGGTRHMLGKLLSVVTAFTLGHSLTLLLGAMDWVTLPPQPVEVAIAASIMVSAVHAWRPIFPHREAWIAGFFGLVHGLAFASAIRELDLRGARLATGVLAFNLGIETVQIAVVLVAAPLLIVLARGPYYQRVRQAGAAGAGVMALIWLVERIGDMMQS